MRLPARSAVLIAAVVLFLALAVGCYSCHARKVLARSNAELTRDPATGIIRGAEPVRINRRRSRACLLLHGFTSSPADFGELPLSLDGAGWDVYVPLLPGHGTRPEDMEGVSGQDLYRAARKRFLELRETYPTLALVGFSMGGTIATGLATSGRTEKLVLINPFWQVRYKWHYVLPPRWWHRLVSPLLDYVARAEGSVPVNMPGGADDIVMYRVFPTSALDSLFALCDTVSAEAGPGKAASPALLLYSEGDETASPRAMRRMWRRFSGPGSKEVRFRRSNHQILHDYERHEAVRAIVDFLGSDQGTNPPGSDERKAQENPPDE